TLAGYEIWNGVILKVLNQGVVVIQSNAINNFSSYLFGSTAGWIMAGIVSALYVGGMLWSATAGVRHGIAIRDPIVLAFKIVIVPAISLVTVYILNKSGGVPLGVLLMVGALLLGTFVAKRTTFGRHVYAVGGNAEAARRAGINVARIRIFVFMISGGMSGRGEVRNALIGAALIYTIQSGMFIKGYATGIIFMVTGVILLLAVTFDTIV